MSNAPAGLYLVAFFFLNACGAIDEGTAFPSERDAQTVQPAAAPETAAPASLPAAPRLSPYMNAREAIDRRDLARALAEIGAADVPAAYRAFHRARAFQADGDTRTALASFEEAARDTSLVLSRNARSLRVALLLADGKFEIARAEILAHGSGEPGDTLLLAEAEIGRGNYEAARAALVAAATGNGRSSADRPLSRARAVRRLASLEAASYILVETEGDTLLSLADAAYAGGEANLAANLFRRARTASAPRSASARRAGLGEARALTRADRFAEALAAYRALPTGGTGGDEIAYQIATLLERLGRDREAQAAYDAFLARFRSSTYRDDALWRRALLLERARGTEAGIKALQDLIRRAPRSSWADDAAWRIGTIRLIEGKPDEAVRAFRDAVRRFPRSDFAQGMRYWIGRAAELSADSAGPPAARAVRRQAAREAYLDVVLDGRSPYYRLRAGEGLRRLLSADEIEALRGEADIALDHGDTALAVGYLRAHRYATGAARPDRIARSLAAQLPEWRDLDDTFLRLSDPEAFAALFPPRARARASTRLGAAFSLARAGAWDEAAEEMSGLLSESPADGRDTGANLALTHLYAMAGRPLLSIREISALEKRLSPSLTPGEMPAFFSRLLYPLHYRRLLEPLARRENLDPDFVQALVREESRFEAGIVSSAGAQGLMQLMPPTAQRVAVELRIPDTAIPLADPATNLSLGTRYLSKMRARFGGREILAMAAYNAGPAHASRWLRSSGVMHDTAPLTIPEDLFIERITFRETREYVKRILGTLAAYKELAAE